ncbi:MAG TPA: hypothetical protein VH879_07575 [Gemmatimonadales bacterium]
MSRIKLRNPTGQEYSFYTREEFILALGHGNITTEWEIFHGKAGCWLPITVHPAFQLWQPSRVRPTSESRGEAAAG